MNKKWARYAIDELIPLYRHETQDHYKGLRFYLSELSQFIDQSRKQEIESIENSLGNANGDQRRINWAYHYPVHWDDIFDENLKASVVLISISFWEYMATGVAKQMLCAIQSFQSSKNFFNSKGDTFEKIKGVLRWAQCDTDDIPSWSDMRNLYKLRNSILHNGGFVRERDVKYFRNIKYMRGVSDRSPINIELELVDFVISRCEKFLEELYEQWLKSSEAIFMENNNHEEK